MVKKNSRVAGWQPASASYADPKNCKCFFKIILEHLNGITTIRYAHLRLGFLRGNQRRKFVRSLDQILDSEADKPVEKTKKWSEVFEKKDKIDWLGDQESNLGSKIQNLMSCP